MSTKRTVKVSITITDDEGYTSKNVREGDCLGSDIGSCLSGLSVRQLYDLAKAIDFVIDSGNAVSLGDADRVLNDALSEAAAALIAYWDEHDKNLRKRADLEQQPPADAS